MAKSLIGIVSSDKRDKTITVSIVSRETHPLYRKQYTKTRKYTAHDEKNEAKAGDKVEIVACRPFAKTVSYKLVKVLEKSHGTVTLKEDVTDVKMPEKVGADAEAKAAAKAAAEAEEASQKEVEE
ncbi:30S ribosomal protein S17 [Candidatus Saccharibacteria bacterium]|nr:30S ribosomal protein S17 [Candidatus Saccharibacteria bacterium]